MRLFLPLIHGLCAFFRPLLTPVSTAPFSPASQFTVCNSRFARPRFALRVFLGCFRTFCDLFSRVLFPFCPLCWPPLFQPFLGSFFALFFSAPQKGVCSVERRAQHRAWREAVSDGPLRKVQEGISFPQRKTKGGETQGRGKHTIKAPPKTVLDPPHL